MRIAYPRTVSSKIKHKKHQTGGGGGGIDLATMTIPKYRGHTANNLPENAGGPATIPGNVQDGDLMVFYAFAIGGSYGGPSDGTWDLQIDSASMLRVWTKKWHTGDSMSVPMSTIGGATGTYGILVYSNVDHVHATPVAAGNSSVVVPPVAWAALPVGSRALMFQANNSNGDYPLNIGADGWRTDVDARRWDYGGIVMSSADPDVWNANCVLHQYWGTSIMGGIMLVGPTAYAAHWDLIPAAVRPTYLGGSGYSWNSNPTAPWDGLPAMQEGDLWLIGTGGNDFGHARVGQGNDSGDQGIWCFGEQTTNFCTVLHGRFISAAEALANSVGTRHILTNFQSHGAVMLRGVNPHAPLRRIIEKAAWSSDITYADFVAGVNTMPVASVGSNGHSQYTHNWSHIAGHVRWNPQGAIFCEEVTDGQTVSGLHIQDNEGQGVANVLMEMRGK